MNKHLQRFARFRAESFGFICPGRSIEKVFVKLLERANLRCRKFDLGKQLHIAVILGVAQNAFQLVFFDQITIGTKLYLAANEQVGQRAKNGRVIPAVWLALKPLEQTFESRANSSPIIALDESQKLLL